MTDRRAEGEAGARLLAEWIRYSWDGISEGRIGDKGFPQWATNGIGRLGYQGGKQDLRDLATAIAKAEHTILSAQLAEARAAHHKIKLLYDIALRQGDDAAIGLSHALDALTAALGTTE